MRPRLRRPLDSRIFRLALAGGLPAVLVAGYGLLDGDLSTRAATTLAVVMLGSWLCFALAAREAIRRPLQTTANLLSALREGDFSIRAPRVNPEDPLGEILLEVNTLGDTLQRERTSAAEATFLLEAVMSEIDVAIFAFDSARRLQLANPTGLRLLDWKPEKPWQGATAEALGLAEALEGEPTRLLATTRFPGGNGRWGLRRKSFRAQGRPHTLVVIGDLSRPLREEELRTWQRLVRVLGHELNNSLAAISSIAESLEDFATNPARRASDWEDDLRSGLGIIRNRAAGLNQFISAYARLARLPEPQLAPVPLMPLLQRVVELEDAAARVIQVESALAVTVLADAAQLEQALINLVKNAIEAVASRSHAIAVGGVRIRWETRKERLYLEIEDDGPGVVNPSNLFTPYFTTKPGGSGIGLVLSRQIIENHGGQLSLENRPSEGPSGCRVQIQLPLAQN